MTDFTMDNIHLGQKVYVNNDDFDGRSSTPVTIVSRDLNKSFYTGFNPSAQMTIWIDKDNIDNVSKAPKFKTHFEYSGNAMTVRKAYEEYYRIKYDRNVEDRDYIEIDEMER